MAERCSTLRRGRRRIEFVPAVPPELAARWLASWEGLFGPGRRPVPGLPAKEDLARADEPLGPVVFKRERFSGLGALARRFRLRRTRAARAFALGRAMEAAGVPTPAPLAVVRSPAGRAGFATGLVTRFLAGGGPWEAVARPGGDPEKILQALAEAIAALHRAGFRHRDLKAPNLLVTEEEPGRPAVWFLDLDGAARCLAPPGPATTRRDLSRLAASFASAPARAAGVGPAYWLAFVARYLAARRGAPAAEKEVVRLAAATARVAARRIAHHERTGRPLA
ncbi:MAG: lipopolysaccharide kinase InaA family protein [Planctomycetota bacterium]